MIGTRFQRIVCKTVRSATTTSKLDTPLLAAPETRPAVAVDGREVPAVLVTDEGEDVAAVVDKVRTVTVLVVVAGEAALVKVGVGLSDCVGLGIAVGRSGGAVEVHEAGRLQRERSTMR